MGQEASPFSLVLSFWASRKRKNRSIGASKSSDFSDGRFPPGSDTRQAIERIVGPHGIVFFHPLLHDLPDLGQLAALVRRYSLFSTTSFST